MLLMHAAPRDAKGWPFNRIVPPIGRRFGVNSRLNSPAQYNQVFRSSCRSVDNYLVVIARQNQQQQARLGLAISAKRLKLAVSRNRLKRLVRESFRQHQEALRGLDVVVITSKNLKHFSNNAIHRSLEKHWQQVSKCKASSSD
ncbi:MAG TPA: ribonuclease P protein component [Gammaproteobacteria bacterium]|nr:ribonuclease P protein component [Gammaproteobacteria bacterium]